MTNLLIGLLTLMLLLHPFLMGRARLSQDDVLEFSCSTFPPDLSEAALISRYGRENIVSRRVVGGDDGPDEGTVLLPDRDDAKVEIGWWDAQSKRDRGGSEFEVIAVDGGHQTESCLEPIF